MSKPNLLKSVLPYIISVAVILLVNILFFMPQLEGKKVIMGDIVSHKGASKEMADFKKKTGEDTQWTNALFGGMPTYQISSIQPNNVFRKIEKVFMLGFDRPLGYFIYGGLSFFILLLCLRINPWLATLGAVSFCLATGSLVLFEAGHASKIQVLMASPLVLAGMVMIFRKNYFLGWLIFALGFGMNVGANHYQITYYLGILLGLYFLMESVAILRNKEIKHWLISLALFIAGVLVVLGTSASQLVSTYEYAKDTMRGEPILSQQTDENSSSAVDGLAWNYAMNWSNGFGDVLATVHPSAVGGGSGYTVNSKDSEFAKGIKRLGGGGGKTTKIPAYFGQLPFTSGPNYMGGLFFFLFLFGALVYKGRFKWWVISAIVFSYLLSMGKNCEIVNRTLFDYLPMFDKFRAPSSVLTITQILFPILGILGLQQLINEKDRVVLIKPLMIATGITAVFYLFFSFLAPSMMDLSSPGDQRYAQYGLVDALENDRASIMRSDGLRLLFICLLSAGLIWAFIKEKINLYILVGGLTIFSFLDMYTVGKKYLGNDDFVKERQVNQVHSQRTVDQQILKDSDPYFRVLDLSEDTYNSNKTSYYHKSIGGYHAAKLQRYQDIIDRHIKPGNPRALNMLNTKYIISKNEAGELYQQLNPAALGNAWFVNSIKVVNSADEEINALNSFDPKGEAIVHKEFQSKLKSQSFQKNGTISLSSYAPNKLVFRSNSQSDQFAVFSDIWYGPDKGWKAYVDGNEVDILRANYILRAINIPTGQHEVIFEFKPETYHSGQTISLASSGLYVLLLIGFIIKMILDRKKLQSA